MIEQMKLNFLQKYNLTRSISEAQSKAIKAALQHNKLYSPNVSLKKKEEIRATLVAELTSKAEKYVDSQTVTQFEKDFISLQSNMNKLYGNEFLNNGKKYDKEFRISHAQKILSVYLKHLWCLGKITTPPICPIDNVVLQLTEAKGVDTKWTHVNSIEEHRIRMVFIENEARKKNLPIAEWELLNFKA